MCMKYVLREQKTLDAAYALGCPSNSAAAPSASAAGSVSAKKWGPLHMYHFRRLRETGENLTRAWGESKRLFALLSQEEKDIYADMARYARDGAATEADSDSDALEDILAFDAGDDCPLPWVQEPRQMLVPVTERSGDDALEYERSYPLSPRLVDNAPSMLKLAEAFERRCQCIVGETMPADLVVQQPRKACQDVGACQTKWASKGWEWRKYVFFNETMRLSISRSPPGANAPCRTTLDLYVFVGSMEGIPRLTRIVWIEWSS